MISLKDILDGAKERTASPFFITYFTIVFIRNWEIFFLLFNFDSSCNLTCKLNLINKNIPENNIFLEGLYNLLYTILLLAIGYGCVILTKVFTDVAYHRILPHIREKAVSKLVINKSVHENVREERDEYLQKIINLTEQMSSLESKNSLLKSEKNSLETQIALKDNELLKLDTDKKLVEDRLESSNKSIKDLEKELIDHQNQIESIRKEFMGGKDMLFSLLKNISWFTDTYLDEIHNHNSSKLPLFLKNDFAHLKDNNYLRFLKDFSVDRENVNVSYNKKILETLLDRKIIWREKTDSKDDYNNDYSLTYYGEFLMRLSQKNP